MRSLLLLLILANLAFVGFELGAFDWIGPDAEPTAATQLNPEKLRLIRDPSSRPPPRPVAATPPSASDAATPPAP